MTSIKFDTIPSISFIEKSLITFCISSLLSFLLYFCECIYIKIKIKGLEIEEEAIQARDNYIIENKLPHKLSTQY